MYYYTKEIWASEKKRAKDRWILLFCIFETKNQNKNKTENSVFKKYNPKMTNCMADLSFRLYLKKESCLYDINIKRTFSDHNLSDANSLVALPHSETSCRLLFIHVSITDWWFSWYISSSPVYHWSRRHAYYLYTEIWREKKRDYLRSRDTELTFLVNDTDNVPIWEFGGQSWSDLSSWGLCNFGIAISFSLYHSSWRFQYCI